MKHKVKKSHGRKNADNTQNMLKAFVGFSRI
jgi:hypothetical protein